MRDLRHRASLQRARTALENWAGVRVADSQDAHETTALALVGWVMAEAALRREESRGAHHRVDFPEPKREWRHRQLFALPPRPSLLTPVAATACAGVEVSS